MALIYFIRCCFYLQLSGKYVGFFLNKSIYIKKEKKKNSTTHDVKLAYKF